MKTAEEMYRYCLDNNYGEGFNKRWGLKHFKVIEDNLTPDEEVLMTFIGLHNYISTTKHDSNYAYAITNKRIIMAQKKLIGENVKLVLLDNLNDVSLQTGIVFGIINFDTIKEEFNVAVAKNHARPIFDNLHSILFSKKDKKDEKDAASSSIVEQLKGLKELLDNGILTQEEFEQQKQKILNG